jgi:hypothetical protein
MVGAAAIEEVCALASAQQRWLYANAPSSSEACTRVARPRPRRTAQLHFTLQLACCASLLPRSMAGVQA